MSKRELNRKASLIVVATPAPYSAGRFEARLDGDDRILCVSRTPFIDAARKLLADAICEPRIGILRAHCASLAL
jgi:hypothetical protein